MFINDLFNDKNKTLNEVSNELLGRYKKAAGADASAADKRGDTEQGNKRFKGIVKATIKQGDNDATRHKQQGMAEGSMIDDLLDAPGKVLRTAQDAARGMPPGTVPDSQDDLVNTATKIGKQVIDTATDAARGLPTGTVPKSQKDKDVKEQTGMQYNPKGVPIKTAQPTPAPLNVPQGWEAKTQADGSTRISKQGSMSSADYKQNMADYKAKNWTPEKIADYSQRMASGQGYTDAERSANYQQQQQHFGNYADTPLDEAEPTNNQPRTGLSAEQREQLRKDIDAVDYNKQQQPPAAPSREQKADIRKAVKAQEVKEQGVAEGAKCNMTEQGRACPEHDILECPGYSRLMGEAFKMPPESVQDRVHRRHQELRKKSGLPDPEHYLKLKKQKEQELVALRAEIAADKEKGLTEERYLEELQRAGYDVITEKKIRQRLDPSCWKGYKKQGTKIKGGVRVNNCVPKK